MTLIGIHWRKRFSYPKPHGLMILRRRQSQWDSFRHAAFGMFTWLAIVLCFTGSAHLVFAAKEVVGTVTNAVGEFQVLRAEGIEESLSGKGSLSLFEGDEVQTQEGGLAQLHFMEGIEVAMNEFTEFLILSRWEKAYGVTRILRISKGELLINMQKATLPLEVETPLAIAGVGIAELPSQAEVEFDPYGPFEQSVQELLKNQHTEFNLRVTHGGPTTIQVHKGIVEFGNAFNTWLVSPSTFSVAARGKRCTRPKPTNVNSTIGWIEDLRL